MKGDRRDRTLDAYFISGTNNKHKVIIKIVEIFKKNIIIKLEELLFQVWTAKMIKEPE
jgi:hypothetical protein